MKRFIVALLLAISQPALADKFMVNEDGGMIVLTKEACDMPVSSTDFVYYAYATEKSGKWHNGCWNLTSTRPDAPIPAAVSLDFSYDINQEDGTNKTVIPTFAMQYFDDFLIGGLPDATDKEVQVAQTEEVLPPLIENVDVSAMASLQLEEGSE